MISFSKRNVLPTPVEKQTKVAGKNDLCGNNMSTGRKNKPKPAKTSCLFHATVFQNHQETGTGKKTKSCPGIL
jgi:hypothetical protein